MKIKKLVSVKNGIAASLSDWRSRKRHLQLKRAVRRCDPGPTGRARTAVGGPQAWTFQDSPRYRSKHTPERSIERCLASDGDTAQLCDRRPISTAAFKPFYTFHNDGTMSAWLQNSTITTTRSPNHGTHGSATTVGAITRSNSFTCATA